MSEREHPGPEHWHEHEIDSGGPPSSHSRRQPRRNAGSRCERRSRERISRILSESQNPEHPLHDSLVRDPYTAEAINWLAGNLLTGNFFTHWESQEPVQRTRVAVLLRILRGFLDPDAPFESFRDYVL
jgi:hypothetical protein